MFISRLPCKVTCLLLPFSVVKTSGLTKQVLLYIMNLCFTATCLLHYNELVLMITCHWVKVQNYWNKGWIVNWIFRFTGAHSLIYSVHFRWWRPPNCYTSFPSTLQMVIYSVSTNLHVAIRHQKIAIVYSREGKVVGGRRKFHRDLKMEAFRKSLKASTLRKFFVRQFDGQNSHVVRQLSIYGSHALISQVENFHFADTFPKLPVI